MQNHPAIRRQTLSDLLHRTAARLPQTRDPVCRRGLDLARV